MNGSKMNPRRNGFANGAKPSGRTLLVLGAGPGIGRSVTSLFASHRFGNVVLIARRAEQLQIEKEVVERIHGVKAGTYAVDITNTKALSAALDDADAKFGKPEVVFFNAARVLPSALFEHPVEDIEYDLKINVSALYSISSRYLPYLSAVASSDPSAKPALVATSSMLPHHPFPPFFSLSLVKAAQRNLMQSLHLTYAPQGVHVGLINVGGPVSKEHEVWSPANIAEKAWTWYDEEGRESFEVLI